MNSIIKQRQIIGLLGFLLPFILLFFNIFDPNGFVYNSISAYHYAPSYLWFEGLMIAVGIFLLIYQGYDIKDRWICRVAAIGALLTAIFPTSGFAASEFGAEKLSAFQIPAGISGTIHLVTALIFFAMIVVMLLSQFTKTSNIEPTKNKKIRNIIYKTCGIVIIIALLLGGALSRLGVWGHALFWGEAVALWAFGFAWLVKGKVLLKND